MTTRDHRRGMLLGGAMLSGLLVVAASAQAQGTPCLDVVCDDGNLCTDDTCNPATGLCVFTPNVVCDDQDLCTADTCNPATGLCVFTPNIVCDDQNACTDDVCNTATGLCVFTPNIVCNDDNRCTADACNPANGQCVFTPNVNCDDNDPCTNDLCDPATGLCVFTPVPGCTTTIPSTTTLPTTTTTSLAPTTTTTTLPDRCASPDVDPSTCVRHFQCFELKRGVAPFPPDVTITNGLGQRHTALSLPDRLCAPASKNGEDPTAPLAPGHLTGYPVSPHATVAKRGLVVTDQFGTTVLDTTQIRRLLVPTAKSLTSPPAPLAAPAPDHFACYKVRPSRGLGTTARFRPRRGISVQDQFGRRYVTVVKPAALCLPADKNGEDPGAVTHAAHLLCYRTRAEPPKFSEVGPIYTTDQFGGHIVRAVHSRELCIPARIQGSTPASSTSTTTTVVTPTSTPTSTTTVTPPTTPTTLVNTTSTTTTVSTTSTTADPCQASGGDNQCLACAKSSCCAAFTACGSDPICVCWSGCTGDNATCTQQCGTADTTVENLSQCVVAQCAIPCGTGSCGGPWDLTCNRPG